MTDRRFKLMGWDIRNLENKVNLMDRYYSEASLRSGKFVTFLLLVIATGGSILFWQDSKIVNLFDNSMNNLVDKMQSMAIQTGDMALLMQKIENLEQKNGELEKKIESLLDKVGKLEQKNSDSEIIMDSSTALVTESEAVTQAVYDNNGCKSNQYYQGVENECAGDLRFSEYEGVKSGKSNLRSLNIKSVGSDLYAEQVELLVIDLTYNDIEYLPSNLLEQNVELKEFYVGANRLIAIPQQLFRYNMKLQAVSFHDNQIRSINYGFFSNNLLIKFINLNGNQLKEINAQQLGVQPLKVSHVYIDGNDCTYSGCTRGKTYAFIAPDYPDCKCQ